MALGKYADFNFGALATLSGGADWSADLPLANMQAAERYLTHPARQLAADTLASSQFDATLDRARKVSLVGLTFHTLSMLAQYRLTIAPIGGSFAAPALQTAWTLVFPRLYDSSLLDWYSPNWWTGQATQEDIDLYPRHLWIPLETPIAASAVRIEIDDHLNPAGYVDIGGLWLSGTWSPIFNHERGRERGREGRDLRDETPSGRLITEARRGRRTQAFTWAGLTDGEADMVTDMAARAEGGRAVVFLPDADDVGSIAREGFLAEATFKGPTLTYSYLNAASGLLKEIIA